MPECEYCDATISDEDAYLTHLGSEHADELGGIDRRRVADHGSLNESDDAPSPTMAYVFFAMFAFFTAAMIWYLVFVGI
ncbi:hypothetical protein [Natrarchaeobaculum sulfurireducens]|uniref:C2H2-type domain-containing protein n=1 Tax=Natrarchaeobaculum sulfurireducens TaxID=2044521 RepID=A0A346PAE2_9EURY|nr:hypothetical protein [Natrarchaeobaculum sulfurireducens]AXR76487.1 hypothetical protein AArc1_0134 [Natrarchaeobaculum sulfurireducens]AXR80163.1 hypothetical protein AArcMg_0131 [Natrarchaeobaculum sulfurireducens]